MADDLRSRVAAWLQDQGYPLEFSTAQAFERAGCVVRQGAHLPDITSGKHREIDALAWVQDSSVSPDLDLDLSLTWFTECKSGPDKPLVAFCRPASPEDLVADHMAGTRLAQAAAWVSAQPIQRDPPHLMRTTDLVAFGGAMAFGKDGKDRKEGRDKFYVALQGVVSAYASWKAHVDKIAIAPPQHMRRLCYAVFPLIVTDCALFAAFYDPTTHAVDVREVDDILVMWGGSETSRIPVPVRVVRFSHLDAFLARALADKERFFTLLTVVGRPM